MSINDRDNIKLRPSKRMPIRKFKSKRKFPTGPVLTAIVALLAVVCIASAIAVCVKNGYFKFGGGESTTDAGVNTSEITTAPETTEPETTDPPETEPSFTENPNGIEYKVTEMPWTTVKKGDLVLINAEYEYSFPTFPESQKIISLYGNKSSSYVLRDVSISLRTDVIKALDNMLDAFKKEKGVGNVMVYNAYRSYQDQDKSYKNYVKNNGQEEADKYSALPGHSDYHSGASFELRYLVDGANYPLNSKPEYTWLVDNMHKYGFILRYPTDKASVTGNDFEPFHFRYVGQLHASLMKQYDLCLEEYLSYLKQYTYSGKHLDVTVAGIKYELYYVGTSNGNPIDLPLPTNYPYTISGDNMNGVIVAAEIGKAA